METDFYTPGPCAPWPILWRCDLTGISPEITGIAAQAASEILYYATAQRFGLCRTALRPCRDECYPNGQLPNGWYQYGTYPRPTWINGTWYNLTCGVCTTNCSCSFVSEVTLPGPVASIVQVTEDGVILTPDTDYRLDDYRKLVRLGAMWPYCNDLNKASTEVGTWEVIADFGEPVPVLGQMAAGELACQFLDFLLGQDCDLPPGVTSITRQGVSMDFQDVMTDLSTFFSKSYISYLFVKTYNPDGLRARAKVYDIDGSDFRVVGTP
jgi:hypothetical protein